MNFKLYRSYYLVAFLVFAIILIAIFSSSKKSPEPKAFLNGHPPGENALYVPDQKPSGEVFIPLVVIRDGGYVIIHKMERGAPGDIVGISEYYTGGEHWNVRVPLSKQSVDGETLFAMLHKDNGDKTFSTKDDLPVGLDKKEVIMMAFKISEQAKPIKSY